MSSPSAPAAKGAEKKKTGAPDIWRLEAIPVARSPPTPAASPVVMKSSVVYGTAEGVGAAATPTRRVPLCTLERSPSPLMPSPAPVASPAKLSGDSVLPNRQAHASLSPLQVAAKGEKQRVKIPLKVILNKVMASLKSPSEPVVSSSKLGDLAYVVSVKLDVSAMRFRTGETEPRVTIVGDQCGSAQSAEESACRKAFEYLAKAHHVYVLDPSLQLARDIRSKSTFGYVNSSISVVENVLDGFAASIERVRRLRSEYIEKVQGETFEGKLRPAGMFYKEVEVFLSAVYERYDAKYLEFHDALKVYKADRAKIRDDSNQRVTEWSLKALWEPGHFSTKDALNWMVAYMGVPEAEYGKIIEDSSYVGYVKIPFPFVDGLDCGGNIILNGYNSSRAITAEENAAAKGLKFLETELQMEIVDFNYAERLKAEEEHGLVVALLKDILKLGVNVKVQWFHMVDCLKAGSGVYGGGAEDFSPKQMTDEEVSALKYCEESVASLLAHSAYGQERAAAKIADIQRYAPEGN